MPSTANVKRTIAMMNEEILSKPYLFKASFNNAFS